MAACVCLLLVGGLPLLWHTRPLSSLKRWALEHSYAEHVLRVRSSRAILLLGGAGQHVPHTYGCKAAISKRLTKRLAPLDVVDKIRDSEGVSGTAQLRYNLLRQSAAPATGYVAKVIMPSISRAPLQAADDRLCASWEILVEAECTPDEWRQQAWEQARRPGAFAGFDIRSGVVELDAAYSSAVLAC
eukprot:scaffold18229_cov66-Phaeocystis_antarctica.AAC.3